MVNVEVIHNIDRSAPAVRAVFEHLSKRERHRGDTDLGRLASRLSGEGHHITQSQLEEVFDKFVSAGFGSYIMRNGRKRKFHWDMSVVEVGKLVKMSSSMPAITDRRKPSNKIVIRVSGHEFEVESVDVAAELIRKLK